MFSTRIVCLCGSVGLRSIVLDSCSIAGPGQIHAQSADKQYRPIQLQLDCRTGLFYCNLSFWFFQSDSAGKRKCRTHYNHEHCVAVDRFPVRLLEELLNSSSNGMPARFVDPLHWCADPVSSEFHRTSSSGRGAGKG